MCEVFLQGGNVRLETSNSESKRCIASVCVIMCRDFQYVPSSRWCAPAVSEANIRLTQRRVQARWTALYNEACSPLWCPAHTYTHTHTQCLRNHWSGLCLTFQPCLGRISVCVELWAAHLGAGIHSVHPLLGGSHLRVPAHHNPDQVPVPLHHHFSHPQKHVRRTRAARCLWGCREEEEKENPVCCV